MATDALTASFAGPAQLTGSLSKRVFRLFKAQVEDWYDGCRRFSEWEEQNLLDEPTPKQLAEHALALDVLERIGRWFSVASQGDDFPDRETAELVAMTVQDLRDRRALWHGTLKPEQREEILRAVFNEF